MVLVTINKASTIARSGQKVVLLLAGYILSSFPRLSLDSDFVLQTALLRGTVKVKEV